MQTSTEKVSFMYLLTIPCPTTKNQSPQPVPSFAAGMDACGRAWVAGCPFKPGRKTVPVGGGFLAGIGFSGLGLWRVLLPVAQGAGLLQSAGNGGQGTRMVAEQDWQPYNRLTASKATSFNPSPPASKCPFTSTFIDLAQNFRKCPATASAVASGVSCLGALSAI